MTAPMGCRLIGRWRIVEADIWERDYLDLVEPAMMTIGADGHGEIAFGAMQASLDLAYGHSDVAFTWAGFDEMDEVSGSGSAELLEDGTLEIELDYRHGDEAVLRAERAPSSTTCYGRWVEAERRLAETPPLIKTPEREAISRRTREALAVAKARGVRLGNPNGAAALRRAGKGGAPLRAAVARNADAHARDLAPVIADIRANSATSLRAIAAELEARAMLTRRGGRWHVSTVRNLLGRLRSGGAAGG